MIEFEELLSLHKRFLLAHLRDKAVDIDSMFETWGIDPDAVKELGQVNERAFATSLLIGIPVTPLIAFTMGLEFGLFLAHELELRKQASSQ